MSNGKIVQIIGAVVDVEFPRDTMPRVMEALKMQSPELTLEVQQQLGDGIVMVPVGQKTLGRIMNVLGEPVDEAGPIGAETTMPIHRKAPAYADQAASVEILETGIKVIDLIMPIAKGGCWTRLRWSTGR